MRSALHVLVLLATSVAALAVQAAPAEAPLPSAPRPALKPRSLLPSATVPVAGGQVALSEASLEYLVALATKLAAGDAESDAQKRLLLETRLTQLRASLAVLERACEAQRATGKPCDSEQRIAGIREEIASTQRELEARRGQSASERTAQHLADLRVIEQDIHALLGLLAKKITIRGPNGEVSIEKRTSLAAGLQRTLERVIANQRRLQPVADGGA